MALSYTGVASGQIAQSAQLLQVLNLLTGVMTDQTVTFGNTLVIKGSSANALSVGVNGTTNPVMNVVTNVASQGTGVQVTGNASGSGALVAAISSGGNDSLLLQGVGSGIVQTTATTASATVGAFKAINSNASAVGMSGMLSNLSANDAANAAELGFSMNNSTPGEKQFGAIRVTSTTVTAGAEDGTLILRTINAGTLTTMLTISRTAGVQVNAGGLTVSSGALLAASTTGNIVGGTTGAQANVGLTFKADHASTSYAAFVDTNGSPGATHTFDYNSGFRLFDVTNSKAIFVSLNGAINFPNVGTTGSAANAFLDNAANNNLLRSTSSRRYKTDIRDLTLAEAIAVLRKVRPVKYRSRAPADDPKRQFAGFVAEEMAAVDDRFVTRDADGRPDWVQYQALVSPLYRVVRDLFETLHPESQRA